MTTNQLGDVTTDSIISQLEPSIISGFGFALGGIVLSLTLIALGGSELRKKIRKVLI